MNDRLIGGFVSELEKISMEKGAYLGPAILAGGGLLGYHRAPKKKKFVGTLRGAGGGIGGAMGAVAPIILALEKKPLLMGALGIPAAIAGGALGAHFTTRGLKKRSRRKK